MPIPNYDLIRPIIRESLDRYVLHGIEPGGFLRAVLENNLGEAFGRADEENARTLYHIVAYCWNQIPKECWGSEAKVATWLAVKAKGRA